MEEETKLDKEFIEVATGQPAGLLMDSVEFTYINNSEVVGSNWDVRIAFGDRPGAGKLSPKFGITMSFQHAKALGEVLAQIVEKVEKEFGKITYKISPSQQSIAQK